MIKKMSELLSNKMAWKKFKCILLSERSQSEQADYCMIPTIWHSKKDKNIKTIYIEVIVRGLGDRGRDT